MHTTVANCQMKNTRLKLSFLWMGIMLMIYSPNLQSQKIYVSPTGSQLETGSKSQPFSSINQATEKIIKIIQTESPAEVTMYLLEGRHYLSEPLELTSSDIGNTKVNIKAYRKAHARISGGIKVIDWQQYDQNIWKAALPKQVVAGGKIRELFVNDLRATRSRYPNAEYLRIDSAGSDQRSNFYFKPNDFPQLDSIPGLEVVLLHDWSISRIPVEEINYTSHNLSTVDHMGAKNLDFFKIDHWEKQPRYYLENAYDLIDIDYEWYINEDKGEIYIQMPENQDPNNTDIIIPHLKQLLILKGQKDQPIRNISVEGIHFEHCRWDSPDLGYAGIQACHYDKRSANAQGWNVVSPAVFVEWGKYCSFDKCKFDKLGGSGLWLGTGSENCSVTTSTFSDISGNGIMVGEGQDRLIDQESWWKVQPDEVANKNTIDQCEISNCGVQFYGAVGIWVGLSAETKIVNNTLWDLPYTGISIGWMWSPVPTPCRDNIIDRNHIHHIMKTLSDGGGIYSLGLQPGSQLTNNLIHDVTLNAGRAESNGMFLDEGTKDVLVSGNIIYNIAKSPLRFHKAEENLVSQNVLAVSDDQPIIRYNRTEESKIKKRDNLALQDDEAMDVIENYIEKWKKGKPLFK
ncbi:right-handed parallel beta-helix repeat-containing protein [Membranihabitans marinus]|uniref:right-handed parallel beta-helix repeat-containing protein n=1 Tax=Membranihabitans marinus TaxID=1227546 RepID=UPI001F40BDE1|nr:right-handed parallel beta-helix repeat-containing protein [Membranihabitans marinus]